VFKRVWFRDFEESGPDYVLKTPIGDVVYPKSSCMVIQSLDPAATENEKNDHFAETTWAVCPSGELLLLDVFEDHIPVEDHFGVVQDQALKWNPYDILVGGKTFGLNIIGECVAAGLPVTKVPEDVSKLSRSLAILRRYKMGGVYHRSGATWRKRVEDQFCEFPGGVADDIVDTASLVGIQSSLYCSFVGNKSGGVAVGGTKRGGWSDDEESRWLK